MRKHRRLKLRGDICSTISQGNYPRMTTLGNSILPTNLDRWCRKQRALQLRPMMPVYVLELRDNGAIALDETMVLAVAVRAGISRSQGHETFPQRSPARDLI